ncbi:protein JTB-like [Brevipalpus obovatus]|uniref:protein JTB-like n=1 Tax=Brevipalpus obovatus TaxID=246614 RepID=UPI003D9F70C9
MIEYMSSRKMIVCVTTLIVMCILVILLESILTDDPIKPLPHKLRGSEDIKADESLQELLRNSTEYCWVFEPYVVKEDCVKCSKYEMKNSSICIDGYKQLIHCEKTGDVWVHCQLNMVKHFWMFEICMLSIAALGALVIKYRIRIIEERASVRYRGPNHFEA